MPEREFPSAFPSGCPPSTASPASGIVYRIVQGLKVSEQDFASSQELGNYLNAPPCSRCGVSVFNSIESAAHRRNLTPRLGLAIAEGTLKPECGLTELTNNKSGHITWWAYSSVAKSSLFGKVIECRT
jgi:hypothetical protein